jgi:hypothetical protein
MAFLRTGMKAAVKHFATMLHAGVLQAVSHGDAAYQVTCVDSARLLLLANTITEHIFHLQMARELVSFPVATTSLLYFEPTFAFSRMAEFVARCPQGRILPHLFWHEGTDSVQSFLGLPSNSST